MDPVTITALIGGITGVIGVVISALTARSAASREELNSLRATIKSLSEENVRVRSENEQLWVRVRDLERMGQVRDAKMEGYVEQIRKLRDEVQALRSENHSLKSAKV